MADYIYDYTGQKTELATALVSGCAEAVAHYQAEIWPDDPTTVMASTANYVLHQQEAMHQTETLTEALQIVEIIRVALIRVRKLHS